MCAPQHIFNLFWFCQTPYCRICGQIFCSKCCKQEIPGRLLGYLGDLRLCNYCCRVVLQYLNSPAGERALQRGGGRSDQNDADVGQLRETLLRTIADSTPRSSNVQVHVDEVNVEDDDESDEDLFDAVAPRKLSAASEAWSTPTGGYLSTSRRRESSVSSTVSDSQQSLFGMDANNVATQSTTTAVNKSPSSSVLNIDQQETIVDAENEEPDWLRLIETKEDIANKRREAEKSFETSSVDGAAAQSSEAAPVDSTAMASAAAPTIGGGVVLRPTSLATKRQSIRRKSASLDLFQRDIDTPHRKTSKHHNRNFAAGPTGRSYVSSSPVFSKFRSASSEKLANNTSSSSFHQQRQPSSSVHYGPLHKSFESEAQNVLECMLRRANVNVQRWKPVLWPLTQEIAFSVQPQVRQRKDDMDALRYVHVKTLQSSLIPSAQVIFGTVCTKSVADKRMPESYVHPSIFVVGGSIEYERVGGKFCPIDPIIMQEKEYLQSLVRKVAALKPQLLVVEKSVARLAQEYFRQAGLTLVFNMKPSALRRIARSVEAGVAPSVEDQLIKPRIGRCGSFRTETYTILDSNYRGDDRHRRRAAASSSNNIGANSTTTTKTLMFFEDCPPDLGCAIILTGPDVRELKMVKKVAKFMIGAAYSTKLEIEFLRAYQACIEAETILERPLPEEESTNWCVVCTRNGELSSSNNDCPSSTGGGTDRPSEDENELDNLRRQFVQRVNDTSFTFSGFLDVQLPYLQTVAGSRCPLRPFFNMDRLYRNLYVENGETAAANSSDGEATATGTNRDKSPSDNEESTKEEDEQQQRGSLPNIFEHDFVRSKLTDSAESLDVRGKLAKYRAQGAKMFRKKLEVEQREAEKRRAMVKRAEKEISKLLKGSSSSSIRSGSMKILDPYFLYFRYFRYWIRFFTVASPSSTPATRRNRTTRRGSV